MKPLKNILITGASGMVGRTLVPELKRRGYSKLLTPGTRELDLTDQKQVQDFFRSQTIDWVFHLAGRIGGIGANISNPYEFLYENIMMTFNVLNSSQKCQKVLYVGSSCVYPRTCPQPMKEEYLLTGTPEPTNEGYALAKIAGLKAAEYLNKQHQTNIISLMPSNLFGPHDHFNLETSHVMSALILKFHQAKINHNSTVEVWGTGQACREFLYTEDFVDSMIYFMENHSWKDLGHSFINIGMGEDIKIADLARLIQKIVGHKGEIRFDTTKPDGMPQKLLDISRSKKLGWKPKTSLEEGIRKTYEAYLKCEPNPLNVA